jgi:hypothetical protein
MKAQIVGEIAREEGYVVGTVRYTEDDGTLIGEYGFREELSIIAAMENTAALEAYLVNGKMLELAAAKTEADWAKVQGLVAPMTVEGDE